MNDVFFKIVPKDIMIDDRVILEGFPYSFLGTSCSMLGESGSGKTLFLKQLEKMKNYETNGKVLFSYGIEKEIKNWKTELKYAKLSLEEQQFLDSFFQRKYNMASKVSLIQKVFENPNYLFCDDIKLHPREMEELLGFLQKKNISFFYVTNDIEVTYLFDQLIVLKNNMVAMEGEAISVLKEEKIMKLLGFSLPFYVNLSIQLGYYGLMNDLAFHKEEMEGILWNSKNL